MRNVLLMVGFVACCLTCSVVSEPGLHLLAHYQLLVSPVVAALSLEPILLFAGNALCRLYVLYILRDFVQTVVTCFFFFFCCKLLLWSLFFLLLFMHITHTA